MDLKAIDIRIDTAHKEKADCAKLKLDFKDWRMFLWRCCGFKNIRHQNQHFKQKKRLLCYTKTGLNLDPFDYSRFALNIRSRLVT